MIHRWMTVALLALGSSLASGQGIPVIDAANLVQAVNQVLAWEQQYKQMLSQIEQLKQQTDLANQNLTAITGNRGLGTLSNGITQSVLDPNFQKKLSGLGTHSDIDVYGSTQLLSLHEATATRYSQIQSLMAAINQTQDPKSIAELTARIQSEQAMITNEQKEADLVRQSLEQKHRAIDAQRLQFDINASKQALTVP